MGEGKDSGGWRKYPRSYTWAAELESSRPRWSGKAHRTPFVRAFYEWRTHPLRVLKQRRTLLEGIANGNLGTQRCSSTTRGHPVRHLGARYGFASCSSRTKRASCTSKRLLPKASSQGIVLPERAVLDFQLLGLGMQSKELPVTRCQ